MKISSMKAEIIGIKEETPDTKTFTVNPESRINFKPGQFFMLGMNINGKFEKRAYSASSSPTEHNIDFTIKLNPNGKFGNHIFKSRTGEELILEGPYGKFVFEDNSCKKLVLMGAGSGVAPLKGIIDYTLAKKLNLKCILFFYYKTKKDIIYMNYLDGIKSKAEVNISLTREHNGAGLNGRVNKEHLNEIIKDSDDTLFYVCGPLEFVKETRNILESHGTKPDDIKNEIYA